MVILVGAAGGCGPIEYINQVSVKAASALADAKRAGADRYAPYEYTAAEAYLHKAREEAGYSDYQAAIRFGKKAELMARKARRLAADSQGQTPADDGGEPIDPSASPPSPPPAAPAGDEGK